MKILRILLYILFVPVFVYLALFFEYLSLFSLILVFSVFLFRDLKKLNLWWILILISILLDVSMHFWLGTYFLSISIVLLLLFLFDKFVSNFFLDIVAVFFAFFVFRFFFQAFIFFQDTSMLPAVDLEFLTGIMFFAVKNIFVYLILKTVEYFFKSYFRENTF
jgi:hypothetical protein